jgi:hypothetical protein
VPLKSILVKSICSMVSDQQRRKTRQFLLGLSTDELQYLAEFFGSCILESEHPSRWTRVQLTQEIQRFDLEQKSCVADRQHKMILLLEFLSRCNVGSAPVAERAGLR